MKALNDIKSDGKLKILECFECQEFMDKPDKTGIRITGHLTDPITRETYLVMFTKQLGWEHASISPLRKNKLPDWNIMCRLKDMFWTEDEACVQYHPAKEDYVNMHEYTLHIWKPCLETLPKPPSIMVGLKDFSSKETAFLSKAILSSLDRDQLMEYAKVRGLTINRKTRRIKR